MRAADGRFTAFGRTLDWRTRGGPTAAAAVLLGACALVGSPTVGGTPAAPGAPVLPLLAGADLDPAVPAPELALGHALGARPASGAALRAACAAIAAAAPHVHLETYGSSHEGRPLQAAIVTRSTAIDGDADRAALRAARARLADPRLGRLDAADLAGLPAVVWIGAAVHGDETSGADAALGLLYLLAADRSDATRQLLERTIVIIDPLQNPDGRARFLAHWHAWRRRQPATDHQGLMHRQPWPSARGNHYLLDLNRDWLALSQPETRARVGLLLEWQPQVTFDLHEMGAFDSYLFSPPREPHNPHLPAATHAWWERFAQAMAGAFGERGWSCYTGDWNEEFNPNRGASWPLFQGAVALLGEQATTHGSRVRRPDGQIMTFSDAVAHHLVAAHALLGAVAADPGALVADFVAGRRANLESADGAPRTLVIDTAARPDAARRLVTQLAAQGIEIERCDAPLAIDDARNYWGERRGREPFAPGAFVVRLGQPQGRLARAILDFDAPLGDAFLTRERRRREAGESSLLYEATAWSLAMALGAETYASDQRPRGTTTAWTPPAPDAPRDAEASAVDAGARLGYLLDASGPSAATALAALHAAGIRCWGAAEPFAIGERRYPAGSVLVKRADQVERGDPAGAAPAASGDTGARGTGDDALVTALRRIARRTGAHFERVDQALVDDGADLGSRSFEVLRPPRVALLGGWPFYQTTFGAVWYWLDQELGLPCSLLLHSRLDDADLDAYDVLIAPDATTGRGPQLVADLAGSEQQALASWVRRGGTLITLGESAWLACGGESPLGGVRARRQVLGELAAFDTEARRAARLDRLEVDEAALRSGAPDAIRLPGLPAHPDSAAVSDDEDARLRRYAPQGVILRADLDASHWLAGGVGERVPVLVRTDLALVARQPVEVVGRFAEAGQLRLSGLLWPEARRRWARSAYLCRERIGDGQVISFLGNPVYRAYFHGTGRLLSNAVLLGPGMGTAPRAR
ncbi:MAG: M14 family zinc carboxypeptidase [Candidatus Eiseniibacteriota bacterium]|jgi:hypothetical protein